MRRLCLSAMFTLAAASAPQAHEFWISPVDYTIEPGDNVVADIRVGQQFKGGAGTFIPQRIARFDIVQGDLVTEVEGRVGDRPALSMPALQEGLAILVHQTADSRLTYTDATKFEDFVREKGFAWALERHQARGLPKTGFREVYSRYGKSLVKVGDGKGTDRAVGLLTEIVALANPYTDDLSDGLRLKVLYEGAPRPHAQVDVFAKAPDETVVVTQYRTDTRGEVVIEVRPDMEYLIDAVVMRAVEPKEDGDPVWESLWASLTFMAPSAE